MFLERDLSSNALRLDIRDLQDRQIEVKKMSNILFLSKQVVARANKAKKRAFEEFREIKIKYVREYRAITLNHKSQIDYYTRCRDMALAHLFGGEEIRKPKRKSDNIEPIISNSSE